MSYGSRILPSYQRGVTKQPKFTYFPLGKTIEGQAERRIMILEEHGKQVVEPNALVKKMIMILKINYF